MIGEWIFLGFLFVMVVVLTAWLILIEKNRRAVKMRKTRTYAQKRNNARRTAGSANGSESANSKFVEPMLDWEFPENDGWEYPFSSGEFIRSWYLNMDVVEEGISELGSRYRILKDNDTGVIYFYDRSGMTPLVKDYRRMRYA